MVPTYRPFWQQILQSLHDGTQSICTFRSIRLLVRIIPDRLILRHHRRDRCVSSGRSYGGTRRSYDVLVACPSRGGHPSDLLRCLQQEGPSAKDDVQRSGRKASLREEFYEQMIVAMLTPEFQKRPEQAKRARSAVSLHNGGSRPHVVTRGYLAAKVAKEGGDPCSVSLADVFDYTHKRKKDGTFVDEKAEQTAAAYEALKAQTTQAESVGDSAPSQTTSSIVVCFNDMFVEAADGRGKGRRVYGTGSLVLQLSISSKLPPPSPAPAPAHAPSVVDELRTDIRDIATAGVIPAARS